MTDPVRLWAEYVEQVAESRRLACELARLEASRSWVVTAPLRWLMDRLRGSAPCRPKLLPPGEAVASTSVRPDLPGMLPAGLRDSGESSPTLYVDVTQLALEDLGAGVQRVTRCVLRELLIAPPQAGRVQPVRLADDGRHYLANRFLEAAYGLAAGCLGAETQVAPRSGDAYLGLDFCREHAAALGSGLARMRAANVPVALVVHDLLPLEHPAWFPSGVSEDFAAWLGMAAEHADVFLCISEATRGALTRQLQKRGLPTTSEAVSVPLGADALAAISLPRVSTRCHDRKAPRVLVVGTVEPRKGHKEILDAFDALWSEGCGIELVLAGRVGWKVDELERRLRRHPECGRRLHWFDRMDDAGLAGLYADSDLLVMASHGEGYGLPIGEAASVGCRLLLRDLPVFREVAGGRARYFDSPEALASALRDFHRDGVVGWPDPALPCWTTWAQTASAMANATIGRAR